MPERNRLTRIALEVGQEFAARKREAMKSDAVPFGMERVDAEGMRKALALSQDERRKLVQSPDGLARLRRLYGRKGNA